MDYMVNKKEKKVVGLVEIVIVKGTKGRVKKKALFDTGATRTSVDVKVAAKAGIGPIISSVKIKNASATGGYVRRAVAKATIIVKGEEINTAVNIEDREGLPYPILIGRDVIHKNFLIDVSKSHMTFKVGDAKDDKERRRLARLTKRK